MCVCSGVEVGVCVCSGVEVGGCVVGWRWGCV